MHKLTITANGNIYSLEQDSPFTAQQIKEFMDVASPKKEDIILGPRPYVGPAPMPNPLVPWTIPGSVPVMPWPPKKQPGPFTLTTKPDLNQQAHDTLRRTTSYCTNETN